MTSTRRDDSRADHQVMAGIMAGYPPPLGWRGNRPQPRTGPEPFDERALEIIAAARSLVDAWVRMERERDAAAATDPLGSGEDDDGDR